MWCSQLPHRKVDYCHLLFLLLILFLGMGWDRVSLHIPRCPRTHCVSLAGTESTVLLPQSPLCWGDKCKLPHLVWTIGTSHGPLLGPAQNFPPLLIHITILTRRNKSLFFWIWEGLWVTGPMACSGPRLVSACKSHHLSFKILKL